jgi:hypothetical protein
MRGQWHSTIVADGEWGKFIWNIILVRKNVTVSSNIQNSLRTVYICIKLSVIYTNRFSLGRAERDEDVELSMSAVQRKTNHLVSFFCGW